MSRYCTVLQCVTVCYSVLEYVTVCYSVLQCATVCYSLLQCATVCYSVCYSVLQCVTVCYSVLQCVFTVCYSVLQCATVCYTCTGILVGPPIPETSWAVSERDSNTMVMSVIFISITTMCRNRVWGSIKNGWGWI